jgi:hypothetical protein
LHRQIGVGGAIDAVLLEPGHRDLLADVEHHAAGVAHTQITFDDQCVGIDHQSGVPQIDRAIALGLDHDRVAAQAQCAQGLVPLDVLNA